MKSSESEEELEALNKYKLKYEKSKDKSALKFNLVNSIIETKEISIQELEICVKTLQDHE